MKSPYKSMDSFMAALESQEFIAWIIVSTIILLLVLAGAFVCICFFYKYKTNCLDIDSDITIKTTEMSDKPHEIIQAFFELLISNTCIVITLSIYHWIENSCPYLNAYSSFVLLLLIVGSVLANNIIDNKMMQNTLSSDDKATIRLMSSLFILVTCIYIKFRFGLLQYDKLIICYVGLVLGRFIYFDTTIRQLKKAFQSFIKHLIPLIMATLFTCCVIFYGFKCGAITISNISFGLASTQICIIFCVSLVKRTLHGMI